jgi:hypothetical protein
VADGERTMLSHPEPGARIVSKSLQFAEVSSQFVSALLQVLALQLRIQGHTHAGTTKTRSGAYQALALSGKCSGSNKRALLWFIQKVCERVYGEIQQISQEGF